MTEFPVGLEADGRQLFGMVTRPEADPPASGVLLLAGVGIAAVGNARSWVLAARALAEAGHLVLRLDCHGFGDSGADSQHPLPGDPRTADGVAGLGWLAERVEGIVVVGECHGARTALTAAPAVDGVREIVALFPPLWDRDEAGQAPDGDPGFLAGLRAATAAGVHVHVLYGEGDLDLPYFHRAIEGPLADLAARSAVSFDVAAEPLHGIASAVAVEFVLGAVDARVGAA